MAKTEQKKQKQKNKLREEMEIPAEIEFSVRGAVITAKKGSQELKRKIPQGISAAIEGSKMIVSSERARKQERRNAGSTMGHIKNMIQGLSEGFEYELEVCNVHFPITVTYDKAKKEFLIKNQLGEKHPRKVSSAGNVEVEIKSPKIKISSYDLEAAGQTAANLEKISKIKYRDRNKFQDGIFITKKPGVEYL